MFNVFLFILFVLGLAVGSFLDVIASRYQSEGKLLAASIISGRSRCMNCGKILRWYELIPLVSFMIQRGRCRGCRSKLSWRYPAIELGVGILFAGAAYRLYSLYSIWQFGDLAAFPIWYFGILAVWLSALAILALVAFIDFRFSIIPDPLNLFVLLLGVIGVVIRSAFHISGFLQGSFLGYHALLFGFQSSAWLGHSFAAIFGLAIFGLIILLSRGRAMGMGDVKLAFVLGVLFGWPDIALLTTLAFVFGALWSLGALARGKKTMKDMVPFGPFIVLGALAVFFFGNSIMSGYFNLFRFL